MSNVKTVFFSVIISAGISTHASGNMTTVTADVGKDVKLSLESNPTTGYSWMIKNLPDGLIFVSGGYQQSKDCPKKAVGCGGEEVLHFIGEKVGESTLKLIYGQPFNKSGWQEKEIKIVIK